MTYDEAKIHVRSGDGGNGIVHFRREKYVPRGGPGGGDGGKGGDVYLVVKPTLNTLIAFTHQTHYRGRQRLPRRDQQQDRAQRRRSADRRSSGHHRAGRQTGDLIADLTQPGQRVLVAKGGRGGRGNARFATQHQPGPTHRRKRRARRRTLARARTQAAGRCRDRRRAERGQIDPALGASATRAPRSPTTPSPRSNRIWASWCWMTAIWSLPTFRA